MSKKKVIKVNFEAPSTVLGIASNEKVWKLCWMLNQALELSMGTAEEDITRVRGPVLYTDFETDPDFDYTFFENTFKSSKVPKMARNFRFWLVIRHLREEKPDVDAIVEALRGVDHISLVHDLSEEKDIKKLLP